MWEAGVLIGFLFENMWTEGHPDTIYWICIGICVVLLLMYESSHIRGITERWRKNSEIWQLT